MGEVVYTARIRVTRHTGPLRTAELPGESQPVTFGVHGAIAEHYGVDAAVVGAHATTIDYVIAAAAG